jgi:hypothetical protein
VTHPAEATAFRGEEQTRDAAGGREPHLSVVAVSRNDDHGGDLRGRMQHFVDGFVAQCRRHLLDAELILVEWNPPPERPPLADVLQWPDDLGPAAIRVITVPPEIHARFAHASQLPLFQMIGKNVGIRRARGRFILATNVDILLDDATVRYLRDRLRPGTMLRVDRYDVPGDLPRGTSFDQILAECAKRFFYVNLRFGVFDVRERRILGLGTGGLASFVHLVAEMRVLGLRQSRLFNSLSRTIGGVAAPAGRHHRARRILALCASRARSALERSKAGTAVLFSRAIGMKFPKAAVGKAARSTRARAARLASGVASYLAAKLGCASPSSVRYHRSRWLHTNACGDFMLLAREDWTRLRGYPEWPIFSWHLDSAFMYAASAHDVSEVALDAKYRSYHLDHAQGSGWSPSGAAQLFARLDAKGIPYLSNQDLERWRRSIAADPGAAIVNGPAWGLGDQPLPERDIRAHFVTPQCHKSALQPGC